MSMNAKLGRLRTHWSHFRASEGKTAGTAVSGSVFGSGILQGLPCPRTRQKRLGDYEHEEMLYGPS